MSPPHLLWQRLRASFWFVPAIVVLCSMVAAVVLVEFDAWQGVELASWSPRLFGAGAQGSRAMLSAIATSMITVAGVVFSITIVALSLTSTQYSPRVLRNFMRDRPTQLVLGVFLGIFAYCLVVLRTIRGEGDLAFIPSVAVLVGMGYALAGIALLIFFIHHVAQSIQASAIIDRIAHDTSAAIDHLFPRDVGEPAPAAARPDVPGQWVTVPAPSTGYLVSVDGVRLMEVARDSGRVVRLAAGVGDFVGEGSELFALSGTAPVEPAAAARLAGGVLLGSQRTVEQDAAFGLQQLVDVALKALSPGINDPTTASMAVDRLGALLADLASRSMPEANRMDGERLRLIVPAPAFGTLARDALDPILQHSRGDLQVLQRLAAAVDAIEWRAADPRRRADLGGFASALHRELRRLPPSRRRTDVLERLRAPRQSLRGPRRDPVPH